MSLLFTSPRSSGLLLMRRHFDAVGRAAHQAVETLESRRLMAVTPANSTATSNEGSAYTLNLHATEGETTASIVWGDGTTGSGTFDASGNLSVSHPYADDGVYHVVATPQGGGGSGDSDGALDDDFGVGGRAVAQVAPGATYVAFARQLDVEGRPTYLGVDNTGGTHTVARFFADDGTLDESFGTGGFATAPLSDGSLAGFFNSVAVTNEDDGSFVAVGYEMLGDGRNQLSVVRFNGDGSSAAPLGEADQSAVPFMNTVANDVAVAADGSLYVTGTGANNIANENKQAIVLHFNLDGSFDGGFGEAGVATYAFGADNDAKAVAIDDGGRIAMAAIVDGTQAAVAIFTPDGDLSSAANAGPGGGLDVTFDDDGKVVLAGYFNPGPVTDRYAMVARFIDTQDGGIAQADETFGEDGNGIAILAGGPATVSNFNNVTVDDSGILLAGAFVPFSGGFDVLVARYTSDGLLDPGFAGGAGYTTVDFSNGLTEQNSDGDDVPAAWDATGYLIAANDDGSILVIGSAADPSTSVSGASFVRFAPTSGGGTGPGTPANATVTVNNVAPDVTLSAPSGIRRSGTSDTAVTFNVTFTDPSNDDFNQLGENASVKVNYGDGTGTQTISLPRGASTLSHVYTTGGNFTVTLTADDGDGGTDSATAAVRVVAVSQPAGGNLAVSTTGSGETITVSAAGGNNVSLNVDGTNLGTFNVTGRISVNAGAGNDTISLLGLTRGADVFGGDGNDTILGGNGGGVLVGGNGNDTITGGVARDILIGGNNADVLISANGDDVLIAGRTSYDNNPAALDALRAAWQRTDRTFGQRVSTLSSGNGVAGGYAFRTDGGNQTVFDDSAADTLAVDFLIGGQASDWYLYNYQQGGAQDIVLGLGGNDTRSDIDPT